MSEHYTDGRRWSERDQAWILAESFGPREELANLKAEVARLTRERDEARKDVKEARSLSDWLIEAYGSENEFPSAKQIVKEAQMIVTYLSRDASKSSTAPASGGEHG